MSSTIITMRPTELVSTALMMASLFSAAASTSTFVHAILLYQNTQRNRRQTGLVSVAPLPLSAMYPRAFTAIVMTQCVVAISSAITFAALMQEYGEPWPTYLSCSIIISSMMREVSKHPNFSIILTIESVCGPVVLGAKDNLPLLLGPSHSSWQ